MVPCEYNGQLSRYHDGELSADERPAFEAHLPGCAPCTSELRQLQSFSSILRAGEMPRASAEFVSSLESLADHVEDPGILRFARRLTAVAAAILVLATMQWMLASHSPAGQPTQTATIAASDEHKILDPYSAAKDVGNENAAATVDMGPIADAFSGGRP